ncbi:MAG: helix-turn-helix transcriptional regulator [Chitinophagales bacterium]
MKMINEIKRAMQEQMMFQSELAAKMKGNTKTRTKDLSNILALKREPGTQLLEEIAEGLGCEWKLTVKEKIMKDYVIFDKGTAAFPGVYQVRGYLNGEPDLSTAMLHKNLDYIREKLRDRGMKCIDKGEYNHPMVVEVWVGEALQPLEIIV